MITLTISGGPSFQTSFVNGMDIRDVLEAAFNLSANTKKLVFSLHYYGSSLGYLVNMVNETYDSFVAADSYQPFFYWEILLNWTPIQMGIDHTKVGDGDTIEFTYTAYVEATHKNSTLAIKHKQKTGVVAN